MSSPAADPPSKVSSASARRARASDQATRDGPAMTLTDLSGAEMRSHVAKRSRVKNASARPLALDQMLGLDWGSCKPERCTLRIPASLLEYDWVRVGDALAAIETSSSWWIGDWWLFGEANYGRRKAIVEADDWKGPTFSTCMNCGAVARRFPTSRRREVLTFSHHAEVASLHPLDADALLDWAEETVSPTGRPRSVRAMREERWNRYHNSAAEEDTQSGEPLNKRTLLQADTTGLNKLVTVYSAGPTIPFPAESTTS